MSTDKEKSVTIKQEIITNNVTNNSMRLASFALPRDLTLGGNGCGLLKTQRGSAAKKVYTPNLNVARNKNTNVKTSTDTTARGRGRGKSNTAGGRGRGGGGRDNLIQTTGVFSGGVGGTNIRKTSSFSSSPRSDTSSEVLRRPTINKTDSKTSLTEKQRIKYNFDDSDDDGELEDEKTNALNIPIKLIERGSENNTQKLTKCNESSCKNRYPKNLGELMSKNQSQLFLLQFPDSLPCNSLTNNEIEPSSRENSKNVEQLPRQESRSFLKECDEGQIGKLIRYKSGKYKLLLGNTFFDLKLGMDPGFLQELVSVTTNTEEHSGNMINLGAIDAKITAVPDWEQLFKDNL